MPGAGRPARPGGRRAPAGRTGSGGHRHPAVGGAAARPAGFAGREPAAGTRAVPAGRSADRPGRPGGAAALPRRPGRADRGRAPGGGRAGLGAVRAAHRTGAGGAAGPRTAAAAAGGAGRAGSGRAAGLGPGPGRGEHRRGAPVSPCRRPAPTRQVPVAPSRSRCCWPGRSAWCWPDAPVPIGSASAPTRCTAWPSTARPAPRWPTTWTRSGRPASSRAPRRRPPSGWWSARPGRGWRRCIRCRSGWPSRPVPARRCAAAAGSTTAPSTLPWSRGSSSCWAPRTAA